MKPEDLVDLGLTKGEASVYLALTKLGPSTVGPIVKEANVAYSNVYDILDRLIEKGIASYIIKSKTKYFQAANPKELSDYLDKQEKEIREKRKALDKITPQLITLQNSATTQEAEVFEGLKGLKAAYQKLFDGDDKKTVDYFFYSHEAEYAEKSDRFYISIDPILRNYEGRGISNKIYKGSPFIEKSKKYIKMKFVNFPIPGNIDIVNDKVLIISWEEPIIGVLIHSKGVAKSMRTYHESIWNMN